MATVCLPWLAHSRCNSATLTTSDRGTVTSRTLVMVGGDDEVTLEHTSALYRDRARAHPRADPPREQRPSMRTGPGGGLGGLGEVPRCP